jgi:hypothetical protein
VKHDKQLFYEGPLQVKQDDEHRPQLGKYVKDGQLL